MAQDAGDRAFGRGKETRGGRRGARVRSRKRLCMGQGVAREGTLGASRRVTLWQEAFAGGASRVAFGRTPAGGEPTKQRLPLEWLDGPFAKERAGEGRLRGERAHRAPDAKGARLSLEASEIRARQT